MTAMENVMVGRHCRTRSQFFSTLIKTAGVSNVKSKTFSGPRVNCWNWSGLLDRGNALAKNLPYGDQRKLEIARALALEPQTCFALG